MPYNDASRLDDWREKWLDPDYDMAMGRYYDNDEDEEEEDDEPSFLEALQKFDELVNERLRLNQRFKEK